MVSYAFLMSTDARNTWHCQNKNKILKHIFLNKYSLINFLPKKILAPFGGA